ncbi:MAG: hypothetical protein ACYDAC_02855 [Candidatus Dormibacteria bacterium]
MPDERRPYQGQTYDRGRDHRGDRPERSQGDRPGFGGPRPFPPRPATRGGDLPPSPHAVRIRDGDRELEVSGAPAFVRQVLDDLPALLARLNGEVSARTPVSLPSPPAPVPTPNGHNGRANAATTQAPATAGQTSEHTPGGPLVLSSRSIEEMVFDVLGAAEAPLAVASIRKHLPDDVTGQQVRRILERAEDRVRASGEKPVAYSLR